MALETQIAGAVTGAVIVTQIIIWALVLAFIGVIGYLFYSYSRYNIKFRILVLTKDRTLEFDDKLRKIQRKGKPTRWRLLKRKIDIPPPPKDAFRITSKGKMSLTAFYTEHGEYKYVTEDLKNLADENGEIEIIRTDDKAFYESQYEEAKKWAHKDWTDVARELIPYIIIFLIFVVFLAFWGKSVQPTLDMGDKMIALAEQMSRIIENGQVIEV